MRKIKFRFWNEENKSMSPTNTFAGWARAMARQGVDLDRENWVTLEYTGLKANGKEIYEGDIYKCPDGIGKIIFEKGCFKVTKIDLMKENVSIINFIYYPQSFEIIGNIYENKDLLK